MECFLCHEESAMFLDLGMQPLANKYPTQGEFSSEEFFPLQVFFCAHCKNVQLGTVVSRGRMFKDYYYLSSVNQGLVRHFDALAEKLVGARFVVDIGSNDGILLKPLKERGVEALGIDPSINVGKIANDAGLETVVSFFDSAAAELVRTTYGMPDVIVASSVFTHVDDPHQMIEDVKTLLADDGRFIVEVEYIGDIVVNSQFERFYLDRIFYYSLTALKYLFEAHTMHIVEVEMIEPHGGSLRVTAQKGRSTEVVESVSRYIQEEMSLLNLSNMLEFRKSIEEQVSAFRGKLNAYKDAGVRVAGYGAPARVATICNYGGIGPELIRYIVDDSPLKQGRFSPGTHIPIVSDVFLKSWKPDVLVVFAYEYFEDIKKKTGDGYRYLIPIPPREIV